MDKQGKLELTQRIVGYQFRDLDILWEALQARGSPVTRIGNRELADGNRRLALVGDSVQKLKCKYDLYAQGLYPGKLPPPNFECLLIKFLNTKIQMYLYSESQTIQP